MKKAIAKKKYGIILTVLILVLSGGKGYASHPRSVYGLQCDYRENPIDVGSSKPVLSWKIKSEINGLLQTHYEIRVARDQKSILKGKDLIWSSGKTASKQSSHVLYRGDKLHAGQDYYWQVRIWDNKGIRSPWSEVGKWEMGLLEEQDWTAQWIGLSESTGGGIVPVPLFRKSFTLTKSVKRARLYVTAHGLYEGEINGRRIGESYLTPGWTSYHKHLRYQIYDVSSLLEKGENVIGVMIGDGWFRGTLNNAHGGRNAYGSENSLLAQIIITYTDNSRDTIVSDDTWTTYQDGPIRQSDIYNGETYDARKELLGWTTSNFDASLWTEAKITQHPKRHLRTGEVNSIKRHPIIKPIAILRDAENNLVIDFGQNMSGWVNFEVSGNRGDSVVLRHAEVLDQEGKFYLDNIRGAQQRICYYLKGENKEVYEPRFTFQGFRYVRVTGNVEVLDMKSIVAVPLYSALSSTGTFKTSDTLLNRLHENIIWSQRSNFLDVPTDCPQRDERLGWTADAQMFFPTAAFNMDVSGFFSKWLKDLRVDQFSNGAVPIFVPYYWKHDFTAIAGWGDAITIIPWQHYHAYGDIRIIQDNYPSMKTWVDHVSTLTEKDLWNRGWHYGDWLFFSPQNDWDGKAAVTNKHLIAQIFYTNSIRLLLQSARLLGIDEDVTHYQQLLQRAEQAFLSEYVTPAGNLISETQTAFTLALNFDMLPDSIRQQAADRLAKNVKQYGHITTGFLGTPYICHVLSRFGYYDLAYELLKREQYPSWLYPVKSGATTIWERWDGIREDGSFQNPEMNSFNHYGYGAVGDWMYKRMLGINLNTEKAVGYKDIVIAPEIGGNLSWVEGSLDSPHGLIACKWSINDNLLNVSIRLPANTEGSFVIPKGWLLDQNDYLGESSVKKDRFNAIYAFEVDAVPIGSGRSEFVLRSEQSIK